MIQLRLLCIVVFAIASFNAQAAEETWEIDSSHTAANFKIKHLMVSNVKGQVTGVKGSITMDNAAPEKMKIETTLDANSISTGDAKRDGHLKSAEFFETEKFPTWSFKSKKVSKAGKDAFKIVGDLTMHGITKEVTLENATFTSAVKDPWGNTKRGFSAKAKVQRKDFGISWNKTLDGGGVVVGETAEIEIEGELQAAKKT